mgnify:CR=1 FL=1
MKNILKKLFVIIFIVFITSVFSGCEFLPNLGQSQKLNTPVVKLENNLATWELDPNATEYEYSINGELGILPSSTYYMILTDGESFKIRAIGDGIRNITSDWSNSVIYKKPSSEDQKPVDPDTVGSKIKAEYDNLKSGITTEHTVWSITGKIVALDCSLNEQNNNYYVKAILDIDGVMIGIYSGQVNGNYPTNVIGLEVGGSLTASGIIAEKYSLTIGDITALIEFSKPEISWEGMDMNRPSGPTLGEQVEEEYNKLISGETTDHTIWTVTGEVIELNINFSSSYNNYTIKAIIDVDGVLIGIYAGQVDGNYPVDVTGLEVGSTMTATGMIAEAYTLTVNGVTSQIEFSKPEISWTHLEEDPKTNTVNFFMINDTHGAVIDSKDSVSIGRVDTLIDNLEKLNGDYIKIHNGDAFQGSYICGETFGLPLIQALNILDFDCFVIGNHEFDWGLDKIAQYKDGNLENGEADFPFLGANIYYNGTTNSPDWIDPYTIIDYEGFQVGIIGVIGETHESSILTSNVKDYEFVNPIPIIDKLTKELKESKGCEVVVIATHEYDENMNSQIAALKSSSDIDAIFCAHTHQLINSSIQRYDGKSIPVVQNRHKNNTAINLILNLDDSLDYTGYKTTIENPGSYAISSEITELMNSYSDLIQDSQASLGQSNGYISKQQLGQFATDAIIDYEYNQPKFAGIDLSIINTGGVRATIDSGPITKADVFEVFPFNNAVVLVNMKGSLIKSLMNNNSNYFYYQFSSEFPNVEYMDNNTIYQVAVIDYVFEGTYYPEFRALTENDYLYSGVIMRDLLISYLDELYD